MNIITKHPVFLYADDLKQICKPLEALGIKYFCHAMIDDKNKFSAICTNPDFAKMYIDKKYYNFDIHQAMLPCEVNHISWDMMQQNDNLSELYSDFYSLSLGHSFTIIQVEKGIKHYYHFSGDLNNPGINEVYFRHYDFLKQFILYFTEQVNARRKFSQAYDIKFSVEENNNNNQTNQNPPLPITRTYISHNIYLTPREMECLHWLSQGKTIEEIAMILSVAKSTIKAHVAAAKEKLSCKNLFQLGLSYQDVWKMVKLRALNLCE